MFACRKCTTTRYSTCLSCFAILCLLYWRLTFLSSYCSHITDKTLSRLLYFLPNLETLAIRGCAALSFGKTVTGIAAMFKLGNTHNEPTPKRFRQLLLGHPFRSECIKSTTQCDFCPQGDGFTLAFRCFMREYGVSTDLRSCKYCDHMLEYACCCVTHGLARHAQCIRSALHVSSITVG